MTKRVITCPHCSKEIDLGALAENAREVVEAARAQKIEEARASIKVMARKGYGVVTHSPWLWLLREANAPTITAPAFYLPRPWDWRNAEWKAKQGWHRKPRKTFHRYRISMRVWAPMSLIRALREAPYGTTTREALWRHLHGQKPPSKLLKERIAK